MPTTKLTEIITAAIEGFEEQKRQIDGQIAELQTTLSGGPIEPARHAGSAHSEAQEVFCRRQKVYERSAATPMGKDPGRIRAASVNQA